MTPVPPKQAVPARQIICNICHKPGHIAPRCPDKNKTPKVSLLKRGRDDESDDDAPNKRQELDESDAEAQAENPEDLIMEEEGDEVDVAYSDVESLKD